MKMKLITYALPLMVASIVASPAIHARDGGEAEIRLQSSHMTNTVVVGSGAGCRSGQNWHTPLGRCVTEQNLGGTTSATHQTRTQGCGSGYSGTVYQRRDGTTTTTSYGWKVPPHGQLITSRTSSSTSWGGWYQTSRSCTANPPPTPPAPAPAPTPSQPAKGSGVTRPITMTGRLVCDSSSPYWNSVSLGMYLPSGGKQAIVNAYKSHPMQVGRCPESGDGWEYWQNRMLHADFQFEGQEKLTISSVRREIHAVSTSLSLQRTIADNSCIAAANATYGAGKYTKATFNTGSGNKCTVIF